MSRTLAALAVLSCLFVSFSPASVQAAGGVPLCSAVRDQTSPTMAADTLGGAFVGWLDARLGYNVDVYVRRVDRLGGPATGWGVNGTPLTAVTCTKQDLAVSPDGCGGALVAWSDNRCNGPTTFDLYVSRIGESAARPAGWPNNGIAVCVMPGEQRRPAIAADGTGGAIVAWVDRRTAPAQLFAARVRANGTLDPAWPANGLLVASSVADSARPAMISDGAGGVFVTWDDTRGGTLDLYAQRLDSTGTAPPGWPAQGIALSAAAGSQWASRMVSDSAGGMIAAWQDRRSGVSRVYALRVTPVGTVAAGWTAGGTAWVSGTAEQSGIALVADGAGGAVAAWQELGAGAQGLDLYAAGIGANGALSSGWNAAGTIVCAATGDQSGVTLGRTSDGALQFAWADARNAVANGADVYGRRLSLSGGASPAWPASGVVLCDSPNDQRSVALVPNDGGGALVCWMDGRNLVSNGYDIAAAVSTPSGPAPLRDRALHAVHHDGQTFLTWTCPPGVGWTHRVYASSTPITSSADLAGATLLAALGDSTAYDRRFSLAADTVAGFHVDSLGAELDPAQGLLAVTPATNRVTYYAVTTENGGFGEDAVIEVGANSLAAPVTEWLGMPRPVFQGYLHIPGINIGLYTLFASATSTPLFPAMANRPDMKFDCALTPPLPGSTTSLMLSLHWRGGSFYNCLFASYHRGEWVLALDDGLPNGGNSFWFGYHENYNIGAVSDWPIPVTGTVVDYTLRRVRWTMDWALHSFPIDSTRVFAFGYSLGGIGATMFAFHMPERFAAVYSVVGKVNFAYLGDPNPTAWFNTGGSYRKTTDPMWGTVATNLPCSDGLPVYQTLNETWIASQPSVKTIPPMMTFSGKPDDAMGWAEKVEFYEAMNLHRRGGYFFWDQRTHANNAATTWVAMQDLRYVYRFRTNRSFPALSNCSMNDHPGNGSMASGDSIGTINAYVEWDTMIVDRPTRWEAKLSTRNLKRDDHSVLTAPDSCTADVTPSRVQEFPLVPATSVNYKVFRHSDGCIVQQGAVLVDSLGRVTIPAVKIYHLGSDLVLGDDPWLGVPGATAQHHLALLLQGNPVRGRTALGVEWPRRGHGRVELLDVAGRRVRTLLDRALEPGSASLVLDATTLPSGVYFVRAQCDGESLTRRIVVLD